MEVKEVKIELTNYCKRGCIHCSSNANMDNVQELDIYLVKRIIDECVQNGIESIVLTGGEATEYKEIEAIVSYAKEKRLKRIKLYTMCEPTLVKYELIKRLKNVGLTDVVYSLNVGLTTDGAVDFKTIEVFLIMLSSIIDLSFHYCLTSKTNDDFEDLNRIIDELDQEHFKKLSFLRFVQHGRGHSDLVLSSNDLRKLKPKIVAMMEKYSDKIHLGSPFNILDITYTPCKAGKETMIIGFDGSVYPCDAMKYFSFLGSGGNIYNSSLKDIYESSYFKSIREASILESEECRECGNKFCHGGCLGQKLLDITSRTEEITTSWYQDNALRTINDFGSRDALKLNAYMGIIGEYGEFFDYIKKLYTHGLSEEKKREIYYLAPKELGDMVWYLSTSLALYYDYSLDEVYAHITGGMKENFLLDDDLIRKSALSKDPLCQPRNDGYSIDYINHYIDRVDIDTINIFDTLMRFKRVLNKLDYIESKEEAIVVVGEILLYVAAISKLMFGANLSEILVANIEKLRTRYPEGFSTDVANIRIDANKKYKEEEDMKVIKVYRPEK